MKDEFKDNRTKRQKERDHAGGVGLLVGLIIGAVIIFMICMSFYGDEMDVINTKALGKILCEEKGLEYSHREIVRTENECDIPKIYCKLPDNELIDGIVVGPKTDSTISKEAPQTIKIN